MSVDYNNFTTDIYPVVENFWAFDSTTVAKPFTLMIIAMCLIVTISLVAATVFATLDCQANKSTAPTFGNLEVGGEKGHQEVLYKEETPDDI